MVEEMYIKEAKDEADLQGKDEETNSQMLVVAKTQLMQQQKQPQDAQQSPESDAPESDHSAAHISMSPVHHEQLRFLSPIEHRTRPPVITPGLHDVDIYRRVAVAHEGFSYAAAAAATASRAGDVSLTLGLQQAGGNDPENSRFGV
ncbi:hypothetical protein HPP92_020019 [Vanilla planifolia]|uniref:Uncharacterized protein n=1 Tax=Vanilla planifolia TaxID=51239 RepID=A0A835Q7V4_VANPL|nr:hypothetical protein HPP92_020019 [Vanilla planifolia]